MTRRFVHATDEGRLYRSMSPAVFESANYSLNQCSRSEVAFAFVNRCALLRGSA